MYDTVKIIVEVAFVAVVVITIVTTIIKKNKQK